MAEPALTALCSICRASTPRYKCPRCAASTCSLACVRRHKAWASCTGVRDATAFVPRSRLRTPAGIDHDYNFLSGIERARRAAERQVVEERELLPERDLRFGDGTRDKRRFREEWRGDELRFVPNTHSARPRPGGGGGGGGGGGDDEDGGGAGGELSVAKRKVRAACRRMGIEVVTVPKGLSRHKENLTAWNKRTGRLNWQIEWFVYAEGSEIEPTRILRKALDDEPVYKAFAATMEWLSKTQGLGDLHDGADDDDGPPRKKRKRTQHQADDSAQSVMSSNWEQSAYPTQNPVTGAWEQETGSQIISWDRDLAFEERKAMQFFLLKPRANPKELIPVPPTGTVADMLTGRAVLEFPTVFVLRPGANLPPDHILGSTERKELQRREDGEDEDEKASRGGAKREFPGQRGGRGGARGRGRGRGGRYENGDQYAANKRRKVASGDGTIDVLRKVSPEDDTTSNADSSAEEEDDSDGSVEGDSDVFGRASKAEPVGKLGLVAYGSSSEEDD